MKENSGICVKRGSSLSPVVNNDLLQVDYGGHSRPSNVSVTSVQSEYGETAFLNMHRDRGL